MIELGTKESKKKLLYEPYINRYIYTVLSITMSLSMYWLRKTTHTSIVNASINIRELDSLNSFYNNDVILHLFSFHIYLFWQLIFAANHGAWNNQSASPPPWLNSWQSAVLFIYLITDREKVTPKQNKSIISCKESPQWVSRLWGFG